MDYQVKNPVSTEATAPVEAPGSAEAPPTAQQLVLEVAAPEENTASYGMGTGTPAQNKGNGTGTVKVQETSAPYKIGDYYNENGKQGVVFEVSDNGRHGKIVSLNETELQWCTDEQVDKQIALGLTNKSDGKANTDRVMQRGDSDQYPAIVWCRNKGYDWYLPAINELMAIYNNMSKINSTLAKYGTELYHSDHFNGYWSSTEYEYFTEFCAWHVDMSVGYTYGCTKDGDGNVRAVSAF